MCYYCSKHCSCVLQGLTPPVLIFVQSKDRAKELFHELIYDGINVDVIHSDRTQTQVTGNLATNCSMQKVTVVSVANMWTVDRHGLAAYIIPHGCLKLYWSKGVVLLYWEGSWFWKMGGGDFFGSKEGGHVFRPWRWDDFFSMQHFNKYHKKGCFHEKQLN